MAVKCSEINHAAMQLVCAAPSKRMPCMNSLHRGLVSTLYTCVQQPAAANQAASHKLKLASLQQKCLSLLPQVPTVEDMQPATPVRELRLTAQSGLQQWVATCCRCSGLSASRSCSARLDAPVIAELETGRICSYLRTAASSTMTALANSPANSHDEPQSRDGSADLHAKVHASAASRLLLWIWLQQSLMQGEVWQASFLQPC